MAIALATAAAGLAVLLLVGPGENRSEEEGSGDGRAATTTAAEPVARAEPVDENARVGATVSMRRLRFSPATVTVRVGEAVRFDNDDDVVHNVEEDVGSRSGVAPLFASSRVARGRSFTYATRAAGTIPYVCTLHPSVMSGRIVVER